MTPQRIAVIGISGSGKSTFAREIAPLVGLPLHHMDSLFRTSGWQAVPESLPRQTPGPP